MSHPNPSHDRSNEYPSDHHKPVAAKSKALKKKASESLNAWGQDEKTAKQVRSHLRKEKKMKAFMKGASARHAAGF